MSLPYRHHNDFLFSHFFKGAFIHKQGVLKQIGFHVELAEPDSTLQTKEEWLITK